MPKRAGKKHLNNIVNKKKKVSIKAEAAEEEEEEDCQEENCDGDKHVVGNREENREVADPDPAGDRSGNDVSEGRTVFIRNLSFSTEEEDLAALISQFGEIEYCLICRDKDTDQSRGSAFVKFCSKESAETCVAAEAIGLALDGRILKVDFALERNQVQQEAAKKGSKERDNRNLYLLQEGWIRAGTPAATGVSTTDLQKRLTLDKKKKDLLKLLTNFVSKIRLCIHNLPPDLTDKELRKMFEEAGGKGAKITECRVMRNRSASGKFTTSKGFGFVQFAEHDHALQALRKLNNNPSVFTVNKRPIVEFSIESKFALNKLKRRADKLAEERSSNANLTKVGSPAVKSADSVKLETVKRSRKLKPRKFNKGKRNDKNKK